LTRLLLQQEMGLHLYPLYRGEFFVFWALDYIKLGALFEGLRPLMSYKSALHVLNKLVQFINKLLYSEFPRYQEQIPPQWN